MKVTKKIAQVLARGERGFTLIELLAVMAIVAVLAGIVSISVSGTGDTSVSTAAQQDGTTVNTAAGDFFADQAGASVLTASSVNVLAALALSESGDVVTFDVPDPNAATIAQKISSRWPEKFITENAADIADSIYHIEFPTTDPVNNGQGGDVVGVTVRGKDDADGNPGEIITRTTLLTEYTAIDFDKLVDGVAGDLDIFPGGYSEQLPDTALQASGAGFRNFLWLFRKGTSAGGSGDNDSRSIAVFKLSTVKVFEKAHTDIALGPLGDAGDVELFYEQIF